MKASMRERTNCTLNKREISMTLRPLRRPQVDNYSGNNLNAKDITNNYEK